MKSKKSRGMDDPYKIVQVKKPCKKCRGKGLINSKECPICEGTGER